MLCTRCDKSEAAFEMQVKVICLSKWEIQKDGRTRQPTFRDSAARWHLALCADCALDSVREGLEKDKVEAGKTAQDAALMLVVCLAIVGFFTLTGGPDPHMAQLFVIIGAVMLFAAIIGALLGAIGIGVMAYHYITNRRKLNSLDQPQFTWTAALRQRALQAAGDHIIEEQDEHDPRFPVPQPRRYADPDKYAHQGERQAISWKVVVETDGPLNKDAKLVLGRLRADPSTLPKSDIQILLRLFPICAFNRTPQELELIERLGAFVREMPLNDERTCDAVYALGMSAADEAIPMLIDVLDREEDQAFLAKKWASGGLRRLTDHEVEVTLKSQKDNIWPLLAAAWREWRDDISGNNIA